MDFTKAVTIVITSVFPRTVANALALVAPFLQVAIDVVLIGVEHGSRRNCGLDQRLDRHLLHVFQHPNDNGSTAFDHAEDRWFLAFERPASPGPFEAPSPSRAPFLAISLGWPLWPATM